MSKSMCCSYRGAGFNSRHPCGGSQPPVTLGSGDLIPSDFQRHRAHMWSTVRAVETLMYTKEKFKNLNFFFKNSLVLGLQLEQKHTDTGTRSANCCRSMAVDSSPVEHSDKTPAWSSSLVQIFDSEKW